MSRAAHVAVRRSVVVAIGAAALGGAVLAATPATPAMHRAPAYATGLTATVSSLLATMHVPGAVVMVRTPSGNYQRAFGTRVRGGTVPVRLTDDFRIGSNTKTMTGTVILQLVQDRQLRLTDPISRYVQGVPNGRHITITELLDMRSGLYYYSESLALNRSLDEHPGRVFSPAQLLRMAFAHWPYFAPDAPTTRTPTRCCWAWSSSGSPVIRSGRSSLPGSSGRSGSPGRYFRRRPTGGFRHRLRGYMYSTNVATITSAVLPPAEQAAANAGTLLPNDVTAENPSWGWTAGAGISNAPNLVRYVQALVGGGLLDPAMQRLRLASPRPIDPSQPDSPAYGLAIATFGPLYGHTGELPGYQTFMGYDPVHRVTVVVLCSLSAAPDGTPPANAIAKIIIGRIYGASGTAGSPTTATQ